MEGNSRTGLIPPARVNETGTLNEEEDVSTAIAASLHYGVNDSSDLQKAILMSLKDRNSMEIGSDKDQIPTVDEIPADAVEAPKRETLDSLIRDLSLKRATDLPAIYDPRGDTLIFIDPPAQQPEQDDQTYQRCSARYRSPMLMKKVDFMALRSSYFETIFGATYQHRVIRRRGLLGKLPVHVKYVVDLTPPIEGDQAAYLTTELCCCDGVRQWHQISKRWAVSKRLVAGQDEYLPENPDIGIANDLVPPNKQCSGIALAYSPVRHRAAIERVLLVLRGRDPQLDSAPKVWTTFAVAKYLDITDGPLTDYLVRWLRAPPNTHFLEVLPEIALRIADGTQCQDLCRDTFAILVGEEALGALYHARIPQTDSSVTVHGRKMEQLPEAFKTRIEYASKAFSDRITATFADLVNGGMSWIDDLSEVQKLSHLESISEDFDQDRIKLTDLLKAYVRGAIYTLLCTNPRSTSKPELETFGDGSFLRGKWQETRAKLIPRERILTRSFWIHLQGCDLFQGPSNFHARSWLWDCSPGGARDYQDAIRPAVDEVYNVNVESLISKMKESYVGYIDTMTENFGTTDASVAEKGTRIFSTSSIDSWTWDESAESDYGSTVNLLPEGSSRGISENLLSVAKNNDQRSRPIAGMANERNSVHAIEGFEQRQNGTPTAEFFLFENFRSQVKNHVKFVGKDMISPPDYLSRVDGLEIDLTHTLVCLADSEWKFLPMWAGGNDDGSGGVFNDDVPLSQDGFSAAGPKVMMGNPSSTDGNSTRSQFSFVSTFNTSQPHTSLLNHDGFPDTLPRGVAASIDDENSSTASFDTASVIDADDVGLAMRMDVGNIVQEKQASITPDKEEEGFEDIFMYSSDTEEDDDDDGDTVNGDDVVSDNEIDENDRPAVQMKNDPGSAKVFCE